MTKIVTNVPA